MSKLPKHLYYGNLAIEYGFLKPEQVNACLAKQQELRSTGKKVPALGQIAIDGGMFSRHQAKLLAHIQKELADQHEAATPTVVAAGPAGADEAVRPAGKLSLSAQHKREQRRRLSLKLKQQAHQRRIAVYISGSGLILMQQLFKLL